MTRIVLAMLSVAIVAACSPRVPDSGAPAESDFTTYSDFNTYRNTRDAELSGDAPRGSTPVAPPVAPAAAPPAASATSAPDGADPADATDVTLNNPGISDEQDFDAVSGRETIESDAERLRRQREAFTEVQPTAVPTRPNTGPNIVAYALSTQHAVGTSIHRRNPFRGQARFDRACAGYASDDLAQEAFLAAGGPDRDRLGLDPDGDGYACAWSPAPFRRVAGAAQG